MKDTEYIQALRRAIATLQQAQWDKGFQEVRCAKIRVLASELKRVLEQY